MEVHDAPPTPRPVRRPRFPESHARFPPLLVVVGFAGALGGFAADSLWWRRNASPARRVLFPLLAAIAFVAVVGTGLVAAQVGTP